MLQKNYFLFLIFIMIFASCATGPKRTVGNCLISAKHGGPYLVKGQSDFLKLSDPLKKVEMTDNFPNDLSWEDIECPNLF